MELLANFLSGLDKRMKIGSVNHVAVGPLFHLMSSFLLPMCESHEALGTRTHTFPAKYIQTNVSSTVDGFSVPPPPALSFPVSLFAALSCCVGAAWLIAVEAVFCLSGSLTLLVFFWSGHNNGMYF